MARYRKTGTTKEVNDEATVLSKGRFSIDVTQTGTPAAAVILWAICNLDTSGKVIVIPEIDLNLHFDGTGATTLFEVELVKADSVSAFSGGAAVTEVLDSAEVAALTALITARILVSGLTATDIANVVRLWRGASPRQTKSATILGGGNGAKNHLVFANRGSPGIELASGEILAIRVVTTGVIGDCITGQAAYYERGAS